MFVRANQSEKTTMTKNAGILLVTDTESEFLRQAVLTRGGQLFVI